MCKYCDCVRDDPRCAIEAARTTKLGPQLGDKITTSETKVDCGIRLLQNEVNDTHCLMDELVDRLNSVMCNDFPGDEADVVDQVSGDCAIACGIDCERRRVDALSDKIKMVLRRLEV